MFRSLALYALFTAPLAITAQVQVATNVVPAAVSESTPDGMAALPDAPEAMLSPADEGQAGVAAGPGSANRVVAPKYAGIILPGQTSVRLSAGNKVIYGFEDAFSVFSLIGATASAGYSHVVDSAPHYGTNSEAFGKREGVAALRSTIQSLATDAVFSPIFHDDPRYYELGGNHKFVNRVVYAATRVVITRSDSGRNRINAPLLLGYGVAAGMNNIYYPDRDRGGKQTFESYAGSLAGAALGLEVNEFLDDALHFVHLRKN